MGDVGIEPVCDLVKMSKKAKKMKKKWKNVGRESLHFYIFQKSMGRGSWFLRKNGDFGIMVLRNEKNWVFAECYRIDAVDF